MPGPWSSTVSVPSVEPDRDRAARRAPLGGVVQQVGDRALERGGSPITHHGSRVDVEVQAGAAAAYPRDRPLDDLGEVDLLDAGAERLVAGELDQVADQGGQLLDLGAYVVEQLGPRRLGEPAGRVGLGAAGRGWCAARSAACAARGRRRRPAGAAGRGRRTARRASR